MENLNLPSTYQNNNAVLRAALYIRVSTAEQAMFGYSIDAQKEFLEEYAKQNGMRIVGVYADEGKSASKRLYQRKELLRMVQEMEAGEIDVILFKDITRWSRNSSDYYKIQDRIDAAGGYWIAVQQPYLETKTPTGRFQVTVMLGNAQLEAEQTSERIKFVNASRIIKGGVPYGAHCCPLGYTTAEVDGMKRMVKDLSKSEMVTAFFDHYATHQSIRGVVRFLADKYNYRMEPKSARKIVRNTIYKGEYKGIPDYCEPYITPEAFDSMQRAQQKRTYTTQYHERVYMFSSMAVCKECGQNLTAFHSTSKKVNYLYYRCRNYTIYKTCDHKTGIREDRLEKWLLENIEDEMNKYIQSVKVEQAAPPKDYEKKRKSLEGKLRRNKELYIEGEIEKAEYTRRKEDYESQLADIPTYEVKDTREIEAFLNSDWRTLYDSLDPHEKRSFWRGIIDYIEVDKDLKFTPHFFE